VGDLNADGVLDAVVPDHDAGVMDIFLGKGNGTLLPATQVSIHASNSVECAAFEVSFGKPPLPPSRSRAVIARKRSAVSRSRNPGQYRVTPLTLNATVHVRPLP